MNINSGTSIDYAQRVYDLEKNDLLQKRNSERRAEQIPEMTNFINDKRLIDNKNTEKENIENNSILKTESKNDSKNNQINIQNKDLEQKAAEKSYNQGLISQTLSLTGVTNDLLKTISNFKNSLSNV